MLGVGRFHFSLRSGWHICLDWHWCRHLYLCASVLSLFSRFSWKCSNDDQRVLSSRVRPAFLLAWTFLCGIVGLGALLSVCLSVSKINFDDDEEGGRCVWQPEVVYVDSVRIAVVRHCWWLCVLVERRLSGGGGYYDRTSVARARGNDSGGLDRPVSVARSLSPRSRASLSMRSVDLGWWLTAKRKPSVRRSLLQSLCVEDLAAKG